MNEEMKKPSMELILYRLGEVSGKIDAMGTKFDKYQLDTNEKIASIRETLAANSAIAKRDEEDKLSQPKVDIQKIILAIGMAVSTIIAAAFGINQHNLPK